MIYDFHIMTLELFSYIALFLILIGMTAAMLYVVYIIKRENKALQKQAKPNYLNCL